MIGIFMAPQRTAPHRTAQWYQIDGGGGSTVDCRLWAVCLWGGR